MSKEELIKYFDNLIGEFNTDSWAKGSEADYINQAYNYMCKIEQENKQLKEVIEEVREFVGSEEMYNCSFEEETNKLLQILDKAKETIK